MHRRSRFLLVLVLASVITALAPTAAPGYGGEAIPSKVIFFTREKAKPFRGRVASPRPSCRVDRKVKVFKLRHRHAHFIDKTTSNHRGQWSIPRPKAHGYFFAKMPRAEKTTRSGRTYACHSDYSRTVD